MEPSVYIGGDWRAGDGSALTAQDPSRGTVVWQGRAASADQVTQAVTAAREAFPDWARLGPDQRMRVLERFAAALRERRAPLMETLSRETGKPRWEATTEVDAMIAKVGISREAEQVRAGSHLLAANGVRAELRHRPHGVLAVFGPFNMPGHLPNGHIVPALLAGNSVVFKPSERTPGVAVELLRAWEQAGAPPGVVNLVPGAAETGRALATEPGIDGLLFTGSEATGHALHRQFAGQPEKILALEMGGNNPLVILPDADVRPAVLLALQSAFLTAGQRCTCARRLFLPRGHAGDRLQEALVAAVRELAVGDRDDEPEPFMGPVIDDAAARVLVDGQQQLVDLGGRVLAPLRHTRPGTGRVRPGVIEVTGVSTPDTEWFGPLLQVARHDGLMDAIGAANATRFGLSAGLIGGSAADFERFRTEVRAGLVNWNRPLTGASSAAPFGGIGCSGNHRPSAYYAADYCADPVASLCSDTPEMPASLPPGVRV